MDSNVLIVIRLISVVTKSIKFLQKKKKTQKYHVKTSNAFLLFEKHTPKWTQSTQSCPKHSLTQHILNDYWKNTNKLIKFSLNHQQ